MKSKQIIAVLGLRRTGKTTVLKQLMDYLIKNKTERENILFYSFDEEQPKIEEVIQEYEVKTSKNVLNADKKIYIFLDEIQKLDNWQNQIKYFYFLFGFNTPLLAVSVFQKEKTEKFR